MDVCKVRLFLRLTISQISILWFCRSPVSNFFESTKEVKSEKYDQTMSLRWRVDAAKAVLDQMVKDGNADSRQVIALGHSEGADVVPWVALESPHVTHAVALAPGGMSFDV